MASEEEGGPLHDLEEPASSRTYAVAYVTALIALPVIAVAVGTWLGWISVDLTVTADVSAGWLIEYGLAAAGALFFVYTAAQVVRAIGVGFTASLVSGLARMADNYELPKESQDSGGGEDGQ